MKFGWRNLILLTILFSFFASLPAEPQPIPHKIEAFFNPGGAPEILYLPLSGSGQKANIRIMPEFTDSERIEFFSGTRKWVFQQGVYFLYTLAGPEEEFLLNPDSLPLEIAYYTAQAIFPFKAKIRFLTGEAPLREIDLLILPPPGPLATYGLPLLYSLAAFLALVVLVIIWRKSLLGKLWRAIKTRLVRLPPGEASEYNILIKHTPNEMLISENQNPFGFRLEKLNKKIRIRKSDESVRIKIDGIGRFEIPLDSKNVWSQKINDFWLLEIICDCFLETDLETCLKLKLKRLQ